MADTCASACAAAFAHAPIGTPFFCPPTSVISPLISPPLFSDTGAATLAGRPMLADPNAYFLYISGRPPGGACS